MLWCGCDSPSTPGAGTKKGATVRRFDEDLFKVSVHGLNQVEDYDVGQALRQTTDRLNQWIAHQPVEPGWKPDPLLATLPEALAKLEPLKELDKRELRTSPLYRDDFYLWEAVWLRDLAQTARGEKPDALHQAASLFDWIVRNIQLEPIRVQDQTHATGFAQRPWETLLLGRGSALDRAWVFVLLARSQGIDAGLISVADAPSTAPPAPGLVGVLHEGEIYLFDLALGLPVPVPDSIQLDSAGQLTMRPATLSQVVADSNVLRQLDATLELPYPLKAEQLQKAVVLLEASPSALSLRMKLIESRSAGEDKLSLSADPSAHAQRFRACKHVADVRLWPYPFTILADEVQAGPTRAKWQFIMLLPFQTGVGNTLWRGRVYQIKGKLSGSHGANGAVQFYQSARIPNADLMKLQADQNFKVACLFTKLNASYWLGLIGVQQNQREMALDFLVKRTLEILPEANNPWTMGLHYNLGRLYEAGGEPAKAVEQYRADDHGPSRHGNLLRARWLESLTPQPAEPVAADGEENQKTEPAAADGEKNAKTEPARPGEN
jgi:hypothetical protein